MEENFKNHNFFDSSNFPYKDILEDGTPWNSISLMTAYIIQLFSNGTLTPNYQNKQYVFVGEGTIIHPSVEIEGPTIIGNNTQIKHSAYLREGCIIGNNVIVGHSVEIKHSILLNNCMIAHLSYIGDSIIGNNANISGGAILANYRLDKKNISIKTEQGEISTGLQKFSSAVGDGSVVGVNSVLNPGTILGKNSIVYPLKSVSGFHSANSEIK